MASENRIFVKKGGPQLILSHSQRRVKKQNVRKIGVITTLCKASIAAILSNLHFYIKKVKMFGGIFIISYLCRRYSY